MRSVQQKEAGKELARLEKIWYEQCAKNVAIDADIQRMQLEIASLEAEQGEKATDGEKGRKRKGGGGGAEGGRGAGGEGAEGDEGVALAPREGSKLEGFGGEGRAAGVAREEVAEEADGQGVQGQQVMRSHSRDRTNEYQ